MFSTLYPASARPIDGGLWAFVPQIPKLLWQCLAQNYQPLQWLFWSQTRDANRNHVVNGSMVLNNLSALLNNSLGWIHEHGGHAHVQPVIHLHHSNVLLFKHAAFQVWFNDTPWAKKTFWILNTCENSWQKNKGTVLANKILKFLIRLGQIYRHLHWFHWDYWGAVQIFGCLWTMELKPDGNQDKISLWITWLKGWRAVIRCYQSLGLMGNARGNLLFWTANIHRSCHFNLAAQDQFRSVAWGLLGSLPGSPQQRHVVIWLLYHGLSKAFPSFHSNLWGYTHHFWTKHFLLVAASNNLVKPSFCFSPPARWGSLDFMSESRLLLLVVISPSSSPDLLCQLLIAVGLAGPPLPALDRSGPCRTPTASARSLWASPDFNRREFERSGLAGLQPARVWALCASPDFNRTSTATNKAV